MIRDSSRMYPGLTLVILMMMTAAPVAAYESVAPGETQVFTQADRCAGTTPTDGLLKATNSYCDPSQARAEAAAALTVSAINNDVTAYGSVITDFFVTSGNETVLDASISADVDWNGVLFGAGILGAGASVQVELILVDETAGAIKARTEVVKKSQDSTGLKGIDVGGTSFAGSREVSLDGTVVRGHDHSIQLKVTCSAESGLVGLDVGCIYQNDVFGIDLGGDPHVKWTSLSITVEQDIFERLDQIDAKLELLEGKIDELDSHLDEIDSRLDGMDDKLDEVIRLLLTPQGRRSSDLLDCDGEECDFPLMVPRGKSGRFR